MSASEISDVVTVIARTPDAGDEIPGSGGCRKVRVAGRGKGKRGGYRLVTFYTGSMTPVFLLTVFSKSDRADLNVADRNALKAATKTLASKYTKRVRNVRSNRR